MDQLFFTRDEVPFYRAICITSTYLFYHTCLRYTTVADDILAQHIHCFDVRRLLFGHR